MAKSDKQRAREKPRNAGPANRGKKIGQGAVRPGSAFKKSYASSKSGRTGPNGEKDVKGGKMTQMRSENTINRLQMYRKTTKHLSRDAPTGPARIQPDRRWFGNTRVIAQGKMQAFRETLSKGVDDPFSVVLKSSKLPMSLLRDTEEKPSRMNLLSVEPFNEVFGKRRRQKRVKLGSYDLEGLMQSVSKKTDGYNSGEKEDKKSTVDASGLDKVHEEKYSHCGEEIFNKGTSKRIWAELYKVVDASDVLIFVLDARDPMGTRCKHLEKESPQQLVYLPVCRR
jgi:nuclear GTP-binding protein